jgi:death-on-curing protein
MSSTSPAAGTWYATPASSPRPWPARRPLSWGRDAYPDIWCKAAALGESIARNYALIDRNKRTAFECMLLFLDFNDEPYTDPSPDEAVSFMLSLATGGFEKDGIEKAASHLRRILGR